MFVRKLAVFAASIVVAVTFCLPATKAQGPDAGRGNSPYFLRLAGSNSIGSELGPALVKAWLAKQGAEQIYAVERKNADGTSADEIEVHATLHGSPIVVEIKAHGSKTGFPALAAGSADIAMSSRRIKSEEAATLGGMEVMTSQAAEHVLGLDGIAIIVPRTNNAGWLSKQVLGNIFSGAIDNWSSLGGGDLPIHLYTRDEKSGTFDTFKTLVLDRRGLTMAGAARPYEDSTKLEYDVSQDPGAIGFVALPYARNTRILPISDGDANPLEPTRFTIKKEDYTLTRRLYLYVKPFGSSRRILDFVNFALSNAGQEIVRMNNFVDLQVVPKPPVAADLGTKPCELSSQWLGNSQSYCRLRKKELLTVVKFESGDKQLDNRAKRDIGDPQRTLTAIEANPDMKVILAGFADSRGGYWQNCLLSLGRAQAVAHALVQLGVENAKTLGYCVEQPVGDNDTEEGRARNRRVEVYLVENGFDPGPALPPRPPVPDREVKPAPTPHTDHPVRPTPGPPPTDNRVTSQPAPPKITCNFFETFFYGCRDPDK